MILQYLRGSRHSRFLTTIMFGFILLAVGGMVFMDVGGFFRSGVGGTDVAKVGSETLSAQSFDRTLGMIVARQGLSRQDAFRMGLVDEVLSNEIRDSLLLQEAARMGVRISDRLVAAQIDKIVQPQDGMSKQQVLDATLRNQGLSEAAFVQMIRREMTATILRKAFVSGSAYLPEGVVRNLYAWDHENRSAEVLFLADGAPGVAAPAPTPEALNTFYEAMKGVYTVPETRALSIALLAPAVAKTGLTVPDSDLRTAYDADPDRWKRPEQRMLEHSVVKDAAQAQAIAEKTRGGAALKDAVKAVTGKTESYNPSQAFSKESLPADMAAPVFAAAENAVLGPFASPLGSHVIVVRKIEPARTLPFEEALPDLRREKLESLAAERLSEMGNALDDRLAGGETLENVVKEFGMTIEKIGSVNAQGLAADGTDALKPFDSDRASLMDSAFTLTEGETSPVTELSDGRYAVLRVDSVVPERVKPFDSVREDLEKRWIAREAALANRKRAEAVFSAVYGGKETLAAAAGRLGLKVETLKTLKRTEAPPAPLSAPALSQIFDAGKGKAVMADVEGGRIVALVTGIEPGAVPAGAEGAEALKKTREAHGREIADSNYAAWIDHLARTRGVRVNESLLRSMYGAGDEDPQP